MNKGDRFGRWVVISADPDNKRKYICKCDCGTIKSVWDSNLKCGKSLSCGCLASETTTTRNFRHGKAGTRLYRVWSNMKRRCYDPKNNRYKHYGGKGVKVCDEWQDFLSFEKWAISAGYKQDAEYGECTIDRIDVDGNYEPNNCRWTDIKTQCYNRTSNKLLTYKGKTQTLTEWEKEIGCGKYIIGNRLLKGWSVEDALEIPIGGRRGKRKADKTIH